MLNRLPQELASEPTTLPVVRNRDRNFARLRILRVPDVPSHADRGRPVRRQGHICDVSVPVCVRHLVEKSLAEPWYRREEA